MTTMVDSTAWSIMLRRRRPNTASDIDLAVRAEVERLAVSGDALLCGAVRQEVLSGMRSEVQFERIRSALAALPDVPPRVGDYETAARFFNRLRTLGVVGSATDLLVCALASRLGVDILTRDRDFVRYAAHLPIQLHTLSTQWP